MKIKYFFTLAIGLLLTACGGGGGSGNNVSSNSQQTVVEGNIVTVTKIVSAETGDTLTFTDGVSLQIPPNSLTNDVTVSIIKDDNNSSFTFKPDGLKTNSPMTLKIPVTNTLVSDPAKIINAYIISNESPLLDMGSEQIKAEKLATTLAGNLEEGSTFDLQFSHFSVIRRVIQDPLYLSLFIPSKYLKSSDVLTYLSAENVFGGGFDWFPGHIAMVTSPAGEDCIINGNTSTCDMIESIPDWVREWNLFVESAYVDSHVYMGARRPKNVSLTESDKTNVVTWAKQQLGKDWEMVNSNEGWFSNNYIQFSCVGLVEAAYESINKGMLNDYVIPAWPLDMYEVTKPVNEITETAGNSIEIRVNPVYQVVKPAGTIPGTSLQYGYGAYNDYRNIGSTTPSDFSFTASNLPNGATFDPNTGLFKWNNIPNSYANGSHTITFTLSSSYPTTFGGTANATVSETLKINVLPATITTPTGSYATAGNGQVTISWNAVSGTTYDLYWSTSSGVSKTNYTGKIANVTSPYTHNERTNGTTYYYVVTAVNSYGESAESSQVSATPQGTGTLQGVVKDAVSGSAISGVTIDVYDSSNTLATSKTTDSSGLYTATLTVGTYSLTIAKTGYISETVSNITIQDNVATTVETVLQISTVYSGTGNISGTIRNALNSAGVSGVALNFRSGINTMTGTIVATATTGTSGTYTVSGLNTGNYTGEATISGYTTAYFTVTVIGGQTKSGQDATITPVLSAGETRIILTWGATPSDLDSHLTGPITGSTSRFHIYYSNRGSSATSPYAGLDRDDTSSYGPETTTIYQQFTGIYRYSVHNFSNRGSTSSTVLSNSSAKVKVYRGSNLVATFNVPPTIGGTLWTVFEISGDTITPVNTMSYVNDPTAVQSPAFRSATTRVSHSDAPLMMNLPMK